MDDKQMMNCQDYREAIAADPSVAFDGGAGHAAVCTSCADFKAEMQVLDQRIARALAIDVPPLELPELPPIAAEGDAKVVNLPFRHRRKVSMPTWLGIAASFALAAVVATQYLSGGSGYPSLADEIIAHLDHEPMALHVTTEAVSERTLDDVVRSDVATLSANVGLVTYARNCVINGKTIPHLVIQGEKGPITLLLLPDEQIDMAVQLDGEGIHGVILPLGKGSIAIIGDREERIGEIEQRVIDSVTWSI